MSNQQQQSHLNAYLVSVTVHGIRTFAKRQKIFNWLSRKKADIILLQETYSTKEVEQFWPQKWKGNMVFFSWYKPK